MTVQSRRVLCVDGIEQSLSTKKIVFFGMLAVTQGKVSDERYFSCNVDPVYGALRSIED